MLSRFFHFIGLIALITQQGCGKEATRTEAPPETPEMRAQKQLCDHNPPLEFNLSDPTTTDVEKLFTASSLGHVDAMRSLIENGTDPNARDSQMNTPLIAVTQSTHINKVAAAQLLLERGGDPSQFSESTGDTVFHAAIHSLCLQEPMVQVFIDHQGLSLNQTNFEGTTPLMIAAKRGRYSIVDLFIKNKADLNLKDISGQTALMMAAEFGMLESVKLLVLSGAKLNIRDTKGRTALSYALENERMDVTEFLQQHGAD